MSEMNTRRIIPWVLSLFALSSTPAAAAGSTVGEKIDAIIAQAGDLSETDAGLWENETLMELIGRPEAYRREIETYLSLSSERPEDKVRVAVLALQCLPLSDYVSFVQKISVLPKGKTGEYALFYSIVPGSEWSVRMQVNYNDPGIRSALQAAAGSPNATEKIKRIVKKIRSGEYAKYFRRTNETPALKCVSSEKAPLNKPNNSPTPGPRG